MKMMMKKISKEGKPANPDVRFLKLVDIIIRKNAQHGVTPDSERSLSMLIGPDAGSIAKIRRGERSTTLQQITNLGNHFNLDFNYFFRTIPIRYELYNDSIFLPEKKEELILRMAEQFREEVIRITNVILTFREELQKLEKQGGQAATVKQSKKMLEDASKKIKEAFSEN